MFDILKKDKENPNITKEEFIEDISILFQELKNSYGGYDFFTEEKFIHVKQKIFFQLEQGYEYRKAKEIVKNLLQTIIKDGHFTFGTPDVTSIKEYSYAYRRGRRFGLDYLDVKKFYYDTPEEKEQLDDFVFQAIELRKKDSFILDLRDNLGGTDQYIYDFIELLFGIYPDYPLKYEHKFSLTFQQYLKQKNIDFEENDFESHESQGEQISNDKKIYVLFNENTASSAESALACFKCIENVTLVGDHSKGCFFSGDCITIYLPHSKIPVYFGTGIVLYEGNRNIDAEGGFKGDMGYLEFESLFSKKELK